MSERKRAARAFRMRGLSVQSSALDALLNVLRREGSGGDDALFAIIDEVKDRMLQGGWGAPTGVVTTSMLEEVVAELSRDGRDVADEAVQLLDAFKTPKLEFDPMRKHFRLAKGGRRSLCGAAVDKVRLLPLRSDIVIRHCRGRRRRSSPHRHRHTGRWTCSPSGTS